MLSHRIFGGIAWCMGISISAAVNTVVLAFKQCLWRLLALPSFVFKTRVPPAKAHEALLACDDGSHLNAHIYECIKMKCPEDIWTSGVPKQRTGRSLICGDANYPDQSFHVCLIARCSQWKAIPGPRLCRWLLWLWGWQQKARRPPCILVYGFRSWAGIILYYTILARRTLHIGRSYFSTSNSISAPWSLQHEACVGKNGWRKEQMNEAYIRGLKVWERRMSRLPAGGQLPQYPVSVSKKRPGTFVEVWYWLRYFHFI